MYKIFLVVLLVLFIGCTINYKPTLKSTVVDETIVRQTLQMYLDLVFKFNFPQLSLFNNEGVKIGIAKPDGSISTTVTGNITGTGVSEVAHVRSVNQEKVVITKTGFSPFSWRSLGEMFTNFGVWIKSWFLFILGFSVLILLMTLLLGTYIKGYVSFIKRWQIAFLIACFLSPFAYLILKLSYTVDYGVIALLLLLSWWLAVKGWEYGVEWFVKRVLRIEKLPKILHKELRFVRK